MACGIFVEACKIFRCGARASVSLWCAGFFSLSSCGAQASGHVGSIVCGTWALVEAPGVSSCGARA